MAHKPDTASSATPAQPEETSQSLIGRARSDDPEAWRRIVRIYGPLVYSWVRRTGLQPCDASDVVQDVFTSVASGLGRFSKRDESDSFRGWLWTICRNKVNDHWRRAGVGPQAVGGTTANLRLQDFQSIQPSTDDEERSHVLQLNLRAMRECRGLFEPQVWNAFWGVVVDGLAPADVAKDLGLSVWAVYKAKSRVLKRLREELDGLIVLEAS